MGIPTLSTVLEYKSVRNRRRGEIFVYTLTYLVVSKQIQVLQIQKKAFDNQRLFL
ncbi:hypothetical protein VCRA2122O12_680002 [Vibrio crassostreae]|nr:hypothetical protein VCRA2114E5_620002 [Vibrio crassostreae]CAK2117368.1 hypothetical protein VCRA2110O4_690002 [Vibrio crassostreae]CAK2120878.1 hypothetical protein VCRA2110O1_620001 [Vibrio crassostreae]CAK2900518.1 hypothetical protein VCRA2110O3_640001 [Vibrio crassostreae]CAK2943102.1 hypothetical protein VCRA2110O2_680002 [Vibrio crassostreae]